MAKKYDEVLGWYTVMQRNDQIAVYQYCKKKGYPTLAKHMGNAWREGVIFKDWITTIPGGSWAMCVEMWKTAKGQVSSDYDALSKNGKAFIRKLEEIQDASGNIIEDVRDGMKPKGFDGFDPQTRIALRKLYQEQGWTIPD